MLPWEVSTATLQACDSPVSCFLLEQPVCAVPHVQKGAVLIVNDQRTTFLLTSALALSLLAASYAPARADDLPALVKSAPSAAQSMLEPNAKTGSFSIALTAGGHESSVSTSARKRPALLDGFGKSGRIFVHVLTCRIRRPSECARSQINPDLLASAGKPL